MTDGTEVPTERVKRGISRRQLLAGGASAGGALAVGGVLGRTATADSSTPSTPPLSTLNAQEAALFGAMADRVFPNDDGTPGATDLGFVQYLDGQLGSSWGTGGGLYDHGPFHEATTSGMGYQLRLVPKDLYKHVAATIDAHVQQTAGGAFHTLSPAQQDKIMTELEDGKVDLGLATSENGYTSASFFAEFLQRVNEALFADPMYGGNKDVGGWKWIGFPGNPMAYGDAYWALFPHQDDPYNVAPKPLSAGSLDGVPMSQAMPGMDMGA